MCLYNKLIINRKYTANKKNGGEIPLLKDERTIYVPIGCGKCIECKKQKARDWQVRLLEDIKTNTNGKFVTLTFNNESIKELILNVHTNGGVPINEILEGYDLDNFIATIAMRRFNERYRAKYGKALRHWLVTELGHHGTENIHLHGIIWTERKLEKIERLWKYGYIWPRKEEDIRKNYVNGKTIGYSTKYVYKTDEIHKHYKAIILTSPGVGNNYTKTYNSTKNKYKGEQTNQTYKTPTGHKIALPIYWRNKIYTEEEREKLWIEKLNKEERWVMGEKIEVSNGDEEYKKTVKHYQKLNKELGYGTGNVNWKEKEYEQKRRKLMQLTRIKNAGKK